MNIIKKAQLYFFIAGMNKTELVKAIAAKSPTTSTETKTIDDICNERNYCEPGCGH